MSTWRKSEIASSYPWKCDFVLRHDELQKGLNEFGYKVEHKLAKNNVFLSLVADHGNLAKENRDQTTRALRALTGYRVIDALAAAFLKEPKRSSHVECNLSPAMTALVESSRSKSWVDSLGLTTGREIDWKGLTESARAANGIQETIPAFPETVSARSLLEYAVGRSKQGNHSLVLSNLTIAAMSLRYLSEMEDPYVPERPEEFLKGLKLSGTVIGVKKGMHFLAPLLVAVGVSPCLLLGHQDFVHTAVAAANITRLWFRGYWERSPVTEQLERSTWEAICMIAFGRKTPEEALGYIVDCIPSEIQNIAPSKILFTRKPREKRAAVEDTAFAMMDVDVPRAPSPMQVDVPRAPSPMQVNEPISDEHVSDDDEDASEIPGLPERPSQPPISEEDVKSLLDKLPRCKIARDQKVFRKEGERVWHLKDMVYQDRKWDFECVCSSAERAKELSEVVRRLEHGTKIRVETIAGADYKTQPVEKLLQVWKEGHIFVYDEVEARKAHDVSKLSVLEVVDILPGGDRQTMIIEGDQYLWSCSCCADNSSDQGGERGKLVRATVGDVGDMWMQSGASRRMFRSTEIPHTNTEPGWSLENRIAMEEECWKVSQRSSHRALASYWVASKYASWGPIVEGSGLATRLEVKTGVAVCVVGDYRDEDQALAVVLKKGMTLMLKPNTPYRIYMREAGVIYKDNFLAWTTLDRSAIGVMKTFFAGSAFPNSPDDDIREVINWMKVREQAEVAHDWMRGIAGTLVKVNEPRGWTARPGHFRQLIPDIAKNNDDFGMALVVCANLFFGSALYPGDYISLDMREKMMHGRDLGRCLIAQMEQLLRVSVDDKEMDNWAYYFIATCAMGAIIAVDNQGSVVKRKELEARVAILAYECPKFKQGLKLARRVGIDLGIKLIGTKSGADTSVVHLRHTLGYSALEWFKLSRYKRYEVGE
ncbi:hypothetical protein NP233_g3626 [Leucocoprinus birnbaumii]|uniref:Uncharacterized protein n=1 Tax=Leucocoprinus birnbaumii TaxID=56174 RepID=A0AAD5VYU5_9AGAR|nr:hypothetical protein NP233_g3626 [Leucocoprinus birnbaumii]